MEFRLGARSRGEKMGTGTDAERQFVVEIHDRPRASPFVLTVAILHREVTGGSGAWEREISCGVDGRKVGQTDPSTRMRNH